MFVCTSRRRACLVILVGEAGRNDVVNGGSQRLGYRVGRDELRLNTGWVVCGIDWGEPVTLED